MSDEDVIIISSDEEPVTNPKPRTEGKQQNTGSHVDPSSRRIETREMIDECSKTISHDKKLTTTSNYHFSPKIVAVESFAGDNAHKISHGNNKQRSSSSSSSSLEMKNDKDMSSSTNALKEEPSSASKPHETKKVQVPVLLSKLHSQSVPRAIKTVAWNDPKTVECYNVDNSPAQSSKNKEEATGKSRDETNEMPSTKISEIPSNSTASETGTKKANHEQSAEEGQSQVQISEEFKMFINKSLEAEDKEDDRIRLEKKLLKYYGLADPQYVASQEFKTLLSNGMRTLKQDPISLYFVIKDLLDKLLQKRVKYESKHSGKSKRPGGATDGHADDHPEHMTEEDQKTYKAIKKLKSTLKILQNRIKALEELEVDLSDEEDSNYFKMQRYRQRFCQIYKKLCKYTGQPSDANRVLCRKINFTSSRYPALNENIAKWLNKTKQFPDYADVLKFTEGQNSKLSLKLSKEGLRSLASGIFNDVGETLQRRRKYDLLDSFTSYLDSVEDPAAQDQDLETKLRKNHELGWKKEQEVISYYVEKQLRDKLEPLEVPDEDANCSPVESGDEDEIEIEQVENELDSILDSKISCEEIDTNMQDSNDEETSCNETASGNVQEDRKPNAGGAVDFPTPELEIKSIEKKSSCDDDAAAAVKSETRETENPLHSKINLKPGKDHPTSDDRGSRTMEDSNEIPEARKSNGNPGEPQNVSVVNNIRIYLNEYVRDKNEIICSSECSYKRMTKMEDSKFGKRARLGSGSDSDCEVLDIVSDEENKTPQRKKSDSSHRVHQVNYAFINKNFNCNPVLFTDDLFFNRKCNLYPNYKAEKNLFKTWNALPLAEITNLKTNCKTSSVRKGAEAKTRAQCFVKKQKCFNIVKKRPVDRSRCKISNCVTRGETNRQCPARGEANARCTRRRPENKTDRDGCNLRHGSSGNELTGMGNGSAGGGEEDDSDENRKRKRVGNEGEADDEKEAEDDDEEEENDACNPLRKALCAAEPELIPRPPPADANAGSDDPANVRLPSPPTDGDGESRLTSAETAKWKVNRKQNPGDLCHGIGEVGAVNPSPAATRARDLGWEGNPRVKDLRPGKRRLSDEEIVRNFLMNSPDGISITTPKKKAPPTKPSEATLQAIQMLKRLKGISATIIKSPSRAGKGDAADDDDVVIIGESDTSSGHRTSDSSAYVTPKIVSVVGNVLGFEDMTSEDAGKKEANSPARPARDRNPPKSDDARPGSAGVECVVLD